MANAGFNSTVKITGTPTAMVGEATTDVGGAHTAFQVTNALRRILDPDAALTVKKDGVAQAANLFTVDYLFGVVTFLAPIGGGHVVTVDGNFLPTLDIIECKQFTATMKRDLADSTVFVAAATAATAAHTKMALLKDASGTIAHLKALLDDLDPGAGTLKLWDLMNNGTRKVLELGLGATGWVFRAWVRFDQQEVASNFDNLVESTLSWQSVTSENGLASFSLGQA